MITRRMFILGIIMGGIIAGQSLATAPMVLVGIGNPDRSRFVNDLGMEFVHVPGGSCFMGSPEDEPGRFPNERRRRLTLSRDFFMQTTEVTQQQWSAIMLDNPSFFRWCGPNCPVEQVSWNEIQVFLDKLNLRYSGEGYSYRLPTEAEWEYACRAGSNTAFYNGPILDPDCLDSNLEAIGWFCGNSDRVSHPVGSKLPNAFGLYDMSGNVWEWCLDRLGDDLSTDQVDPIGATTRFYHSIRGGGWNFPANYCRSASRLIKGNTSHRPHVGFRLIGVVSDSQ